MTTPTAAQPSTVQAAQDAASAYVQAVVAFQTASVGAAAVERRLLDELGSRQPSQLRSLLLRTMLGFQDDQADTAPANDPKLATQNPSAQSHREKDDAAIRIENEMQKPETLNNGIPGPLGLRFYLEE